MRQPGFATTVPLRQAPWSPARSDKWYWKSSAALTARAPPFTAKLSSSSSTDILHRADKGERGWVRSMQSLPNSRVFINVWPQVIAAFGWSSVVVFAHSVLRSKLGPSFSTPPLSTTPHAFLSTALGLVLVFRTNAAYDRFWEGRKIWGGLVNTA
jgi:Bestrophin, RFP-TM, chloride channel